MTAAGLRARISAAGIVDGTISEYTWHSRTRRAISCAYCAPKSTTSTVSESPACTTSPSPGLAHPLSGRGGHDLQSKVCPPRRRAPAPATGSGLAVLAGRRARGFLPRGRAVRLHLAHPHPRDAPAVQLGHGEPVAVDLHLGANAGQLPERGEHKAGHGLVGPLGQVHAGLLGELIQVQQPVDLELTAEQPFRALLTVVFVPDLTDQLL